MASPQLLAGSMTQALGCLSVSSNEPEADPELQILQRAFGAFNERQREVHHWTPEMVAERWALFSHECRDLWRKANVPARFASIDLLRLDRWLPEGYGKMSRLLLRLRETPQLIAVGGARGRGKTGMACGLVRAFCRTGRPALYARVRDFFDQLDGVPWQEKTAVKDEYARPDLLILDEVQVRDSGKGWQDNDLTTLIDRRYGEQLATVLLSNLTPDALMENLGDSVRRRLNEEGQILETEWPQLDPLREQFESNRRAAIRKQETL